MGFFRQEYWSGLPFLPPRNLPDPEIKPKPPVSPTLQVDSLPAEPSGKPDKHKTIFLQFSFLYVCTGVCMYVC